MKNIPDNVVFDQRKLKYDAYSKPYPTSLSSPNFEKLSIKKISNSAVTILKTKLKEINNEYEDLLDNIKYNELIYNAKYNFKPVAGEEYYLYSKKDYNFLSIIKPHEWNEKFIGSFTLMTNELWKKN
jgi:hypothetical protein